ncbi:MAG: AAA family ATPase [Anaerolineaceae bacterium]|nr:MAG: AAA family ATPase [Anaerolineaceae bacterium]
MERQITDDINNLKAVLPPVISQSLDELGNKDQLLEIVLDLGRVPTARYVEEEVVIAPHEVTRQEIDHIVEQIGDFDADNRAGMERTLHRISAIRNRRGDIVGLTCRVGRAVFGTINIIEDLIMSGQSVLMLGPPGVGKTTMLREAARVLAEHKRVVIVDTSNEIGGDGDVPHPAIGKARRMQVNHPERQHEVMIEAVENHNPEVIVIDEIGRELEAQAARTIAERGVQLIGTAHGNTLENLMLNPTLTDLIGGIESVTLSDDEARRRGTQKTVLERRAPPTFDMLVEIQTRDRMAVHASVADSVDSALRGRARAIEVRERDAEGDIHVEDYVPDIGGLTSERERNRKGNLRESGRKRGTDEPPRNGFSNAPKAKDFTPTTTDGGALQPLTVYVYGVARNRLQQAAKRLHVPLDVTDDLRTAQAVVTMKNYYRQRPRLIREAESGGLPIYVLRANTVSQMENFIIDVFELEVNPLDPFGEALRETEAAIMKVRAGAEFIDLTPQASSIRRRQHEIVRQADLFSRSIGTEPQRYIRILRRAAQ